MKESPPDDRPTLQVLEENIEKWSVVLAQMTDDNKERQIIAAKLEDWKAKREHLAKIFVAGLKHLRNEWHR